MNALATLPRASRCFRRGLACALAGLLLAGSAQARELRAADNQVFDFPTVQSILFMDRYIREKTDHALSIRIFPSAQLGEEEETLELTRRGVIDLTRVNISPLAALAPELDVFNAPYLFASTEHLHRALDGTLGEDIFRRLEDFGLIGLAFYEAGARSIYNSQRPVREVADLTGLRFRIMRSPIAARMVEALGATALPMSYSQVLPALRAGLIDAAENNLPSYVTTDHHTAARFLTPTGHTMLPDVLVMSRKTWDTLTDLEKQITREAARASVAFNRKRWDAWTKISRIQALAEGVTITEDFNHAGFAAALAALRAQVLATPAIRDMGARIDALR